MIIVINLLKLWKEYISPLYSWTNCCKYHPSCCDYAIKSIEKNGVLRGGALSIWRILRCNPLSKGRDDPVK